MKKNLMLIGGLLVSTMIGSAATIQISAVCNTSGGTAGGTNPSFSSVSVVCGNFAQVNGAQIGANTLLDAFVVFQNDYSLGAGGSATATFTWTNINSNLTPPTTYTDTVTGGFTSATYTPSGSSLYDPLSGNGTCSVNPGTFTGINPTGGCANNPSAFLGAASTFVAANVSGTGAGLQPNGGIGVAAYVFYDYQTPATGTPEPATLGLCGAALIGLGVIGRKRIRG